MELRKRMIVEFEKPIWAKRRGKYCQVGSETVCGEIVNESYGSTSQHTFTIFDGSKKHLVKGRNLYPTAKIIDLNGYERNNENETARREYKEFCKNFN